MRRFEYGFAAVACVIYLWPAVAAGEYVAASILGLTIVILMIADLDLG